MNEITPENAPQKRREMLAKAEKVVTTLVNLIEDKQAVDVGKGAEKYFGCAQTTLNRAVRGIVDAGTAKLFYVSKKNASGTVVAMKLLAPIDWNYARAIKESDGAVNLAKLAEKKTAVKVFNKTTGKTRIIERNPMLLNRKEQSALGAATKTLQALNATPERIKEIVGEAEKSAALRSLDAPRSMLNHRIRQLKKHGYSNVAIGNVLGISESTVRRRLKSPLEPIEILLDNALADLEAVREELLGAFSSYPELEKVFGEGYGEKYIMNVHTNARKVEISPSRKRVKFSLEFIATMKEQK